MKALLLSFTFLLSSIVGHAACKNEAEDNIPLNLGNGHRLAELDESFQARVKAVDYHQCENPDSGQSKENCIDNLYRENHCQDDSSYLQCIQKVYEKKCFTYSAGGRAGNWGQCRFVFSAQSTLGFQKYLSYVVRERAADKRTFVGYLLFDPTETKLTVPKATKKSFSEVVEKLNQLPRCKGI